MRAKAAVSGEPPCLYISLQGKVSGKNKLLYLLYVKLEKKQNYLKTIKNEELHRQLRGNQKI